MASSTAFAAALGFWLAAMVGDALLLLLKKKKKKEGKGRRQELIGPLGLVGFKLGPGAHSHACK